MGIQSAEPFLTNFAEPQDDDGMLAPAAAAAKGTGANRAVDGRRATEKAVKDSEQSLSMLLKVCTEENKKDEAIAMVEASIVAEQADAAEEAEENVQAVLEFQLQEAEKAAKAALKNGADMQDGSPSAEEESAAVPTAGSSNASSVDADFLRKVYNLVTAEQPDF